MEDMKVRDAIKEMKAYNVVRSWVPGLGFIILDQSDLEKALENSVRSYTGDTECIAYVNEENEFCISVIGKGE